MNYRVTTDIDEIALLKNNWNAISERNPFQSWEWFCSWYQNFSNDMTPFVVIGNSSDAVPTMIAPMYATQSHVGTWKLCIAGDGSACTDNNRIVCKEREIQYSTSKFVHWLESSDEAAQFDFAEFEGLSLESESTETLVDQMTSTGFEIDARELESCWVTQLESSWEEQNAAFSKKHRRKTKKAVSNLSSLDLLDSETHEFGLLWEKFVDLHQKRRNMLGESGCFADSRFGGFLKNATGGLIDRGLAEIVVIQKQKIPIAATIVFFDTTTTYMYQTGFDPTFAKMEPGYMLVVSAMKRAIEKGHKRFDFMRGDEPYKARWNAKPEQLARLNFCLNNRFKAQLHSFLRSSKLVVKSSLKSLNII